MKLGNTLWETRDYQTPGSATRFKLGTAAGAIDRLELEYHFDGSANNGNLKTHVMRQKPGETHISWTQHYTYDALNRLETASEVGDWTRTYGYDRYGNRWVHNTHPPLQWSEPHEPVAISNFNPNNNRIIVANSDFDGAGNQIHYAPWNLGYDAENRNITVTSPTNGSGTLAYDGDGRRVKKTWTPYGGSQTTTFYVYNALGQLAAEYSTVASTSNTSYVHTDMLGSTRMVTNAAGAVLECYDYLPFGRMLSSADNGRNTGCYPSNPDAQINSDLPQKFTGKERDSETRLDYFGARYYSSGQGRFSSTDPVIVTPARMADPQRFNLYAYVRNNPLKFVDPAGKDIEFVNDTEEGRQLALSMMRRNLTDEEGANIGMCRRRSGAFFACVRDRQAVAKNSTAGYKRLVGLIDDRSIIADVGVIGDGLSATFQGLGKVSDWGGGSSVVSPEPGSKHVGVLVTKGDLAQGVQVWCCNGKAVMNGGRQPDFVTMWHELVGETMKYRAGYTHLRRDPVLDSRTVIDIENEIRRFHEMSPRTGADHGRIVTVTPQN